MVDKPEEKKTKVEIARAWKDSQYHESLSPEQQAEVPPNPSELDELEDDDLEDVAGGTYTAACFTT